MKKILVIITLVIGVCLSLKTTCNAEQVAVIVNKANSASKLSVDDVKKFYVNDTLVWANGKNANLYDLPTGDNARIIFSQKVLGKDAEKVAEEWASKKITNSAKNPPVTVKSGILVQDRVGKDEGAVGYLLKSEVKEENVKIVAIIE